MFPELTFDVPDADSLRFELADGTPVYAKQDNQFPLVNITVYFRGGRYLVPAGKEGLAAITGDGLAHRRRRRTAPPRNSTRSSTFSPPTSAPTSATSPVR